MHFITDWKQLISFICSRSAFGNDNGDGGKNKQTFCSFLLFTINRVFRVFTKTCLKSQMSGWSWNKSFEKIIINISNYSNPVLVES